ncbi:MAG TPA: hypothetical protein VMB52_03330 [Verrucomicrobiae bacterium]|nr:hypothetical protein [Verrucomicrobiae bacterium]
MAQKLKSRHSNEHRKLHRQQKLLRRYKKRNHLLYWITGCAVLVIALLLALGLSHNWIAGLHKDKEIATNPPVSKLGGESTDTNTAAAAPEAGSSTESGGSTSKTTDSTSGTTSKDNSSTSTTTSTTTNSSTTNSTTTEPTTTPSNISQLYNDTTHGESLAELLQQATQLGVTSQCNTTGLTQTCQFGQGNNAFTVQSAPGDNIVNTVTKNF